MINHLRVGLTETALLFFYYLDRILRIKNKLYISKQHELINWLYSTSGFYDKKINGSYFNFTQYNKIKSSAVYNNYFNNLLLIVKNNKTTTIELNFNHIGNNMQKLKDKFLMYVQYNKKIINKDLNVLNYIDNKNVLIINNLGILMKQQYESGNIKNICPNFPDNVKSINYLNNGYTFLNNGPHNSIINTAKKLCDKIKLLNFDIAIVSAGAYSSLLFIYIINNLKKQVFTVGGNLPLYFGIITKRISTQNRNAINKYFITVPENMRPKNYENIEGGCYW